MSTTKEQTEKELKRTIIENLQLRKAELEKLMWDTHSRMSRTYNSKLNQIKDAQRMGELANAIAHINGAIGSILEVGDLTPEDGI